MTHRCIDSTARQALHAGFGAEIFADATRTLALANDPGTVSVQQVREVTVTVQHGHFAAVTSTHQWIEAIATGIGLPRAGLLESVP